MHFEDVNALLLVVQFLLFIIINFVISLRIFSQQLGIEVPMHVKKRCLLLPAALFLLIHVEMIRKKSLRLQLC